MSSHDAERRTLEERLVQLMTRGGKIEADLRMTHNRDWTEQAIELENDEVLEGLDALGRNEVRDIRAALRRIDSGSYGVCARCGHEIGAERRAALPSSITCVNCASQWPAQPEGTSITRFP